MDEELQREEQGRSIEEFGASLVHTERGNIHTMTSGHGPKCQDHKI